MKTVAGLILVLLCITLILAGGCTGLAKPVSVETSTVDNAVLLTIDSTNIVEIANSGGSRIADIKGRITNNKNVPVRISGACKVFDDRGARMYYIPITVFNTISANGGVELFRDSAPLGMNYDNAKVVCSIEQVYLQYPEPTPVASYTPSPSNTLDLFTYHEGWRKT